jgi:hypothetical protein
VRGSGRAGRSSRRRREERRALPNP